MNAPSTRPTPDQPLDTFEQALLTRLTAELADAAGGPLPEAPGADVVDLGTRRRRRLSLLGGGSVAAATALVFAVTSLTPPPAVSVDEKNGDLKIEVNRLDGPDELERLLAEHGVASDITYLEPGTVCAEGRYSERRAPGMMLTVGAEDFALELPYGSVKAGETFVLSASVLAYENGSTASVDFGVATGAVAPCEPVADQFWDGSEPE